MSIDGERLASDFRSLTPDQLLKEYVAGRRQFQGINLLRAYIEPLAQQLDNWQYKPPTAGLQFGYWRDTVSPLWVDRRTWAPPAELYDGAPVFHWEGDSFCCLLESNWEEVEDWPEVEVADLARAELPGINLQGSYLYRVNLAGANLEGAKMQRAIFVEVDLSDANLRGADLRECLAAGSRFQRADLTGTRAERTNLRRADFSGADLSRVRFRRANLSATIWRQSTLSRTRFDRNNLTRADFRNLDFAGVHFGDSVVTGCQILAGDESALLDSLSVSR